MEVRARTSGVHGFTLLELLVTVAIVALLVSVLVPALRAARREAGRTLCLANLRQIGHALHQYAGDFTDEIPASLHFGFSFSRGTPWGYALHGYVAGEPWSRRMPRVQWVQTLNTIYRCPLDELTTKVEERFDQWSYGINVFLGPAVDELVVEGVAWQRLGAIPRPAATIAMAEMAADSAMYGGGRADHVMAHFWTRYGVPGGASVDVDRHEPRAAYLFVDAHARQIPLIATFDRSIGLDNWDPATAR